MTYSVTQLRPLHEVRNKRMHVRPALFFSSENTRRIYTKFGIGLYGSNDAV